MGGRDRDRSLRHRIGLILGLVLFVGALAVPVPGGMSPLAWRTAALALLMATWWVTEALPIAATALLPILLIPPLGIGTVGAATAPYANPVIYLFLGGFLIAAALERCGLHRRMALTIVRIGGVDPARLIGAFMVATAFISMWVSNSATVAMMLPLAVSIGAMIQPREGQGADDAGPRHFRIALLLGLAYAASIGGLGTLIGTPPNALLAGFMSESFDLRIGFGSWMLLGVPLVLLALPITWFLLTRVLHPVPAEPIAGGRQFIDAALRDLGSPSRAEWIVGTITALTAAAWVTQPLLSRVIPGLSDAGIAIGGAILLFLATVNWDRDERALDWRAAERLPWGVLVLFGGGLSLAQAIQTTGLAEWIGQSLAWTGIWPPVVVILVVTAVIVFLTELTSNTATAAAFLPVVASLAVGIDLDPLLLTVPAALAASCAFMMPVATPPNAIVYGSGSLEIGQMVRAGFVLNLVMIVVITAFTLVVVPRLF